MSAWKVDYNPGDEVRLFERGLVGSSTGRKMIGTGLIVKKLPYQRPDEADPRFKIKVIPDKSGTDFKREKARSAWMAKNANIWPASCLKPGSEREEWMLQALKSDKEQVGSW